MTLRSFLLLVAVCLFWASNTVVSRIVVADLQIPPLFYAGARSALVALALIPFLRPLPPRPLFVGVVALAISGGPFALLFVGLQDASPSSASIIVLSGAPLSVIFAILILGEKVGWRRGTGILLTFAGVGIATISPSAWEGSTGLLYVGASAVVGSLGAVYLKRIDITPMRLQAYAGLWSAAVLLPLSALLETGQVEKLTASIVPAGAALLYSAAIVSIVAHTIYFRMLQRYDVNLISPLTLMTPFFTIALGVWITNDQVGPLMIAGAILAGLGVLVIVLRPSRALFKPLLVRIGL